MSRNRRIVFGVVGLVAAGLLVFAIWHDPAHTGSTADPALVLRGHVTDESGSAAGIRIRFQGHAESTLSDADGGFALPMPKSVLNVTAWKPGHFVGFAPSDSRPLTIELRKLPPFDDENYQWVDPRPGANSFSCGNCHEAIFDEWRGSAHGRPGETSRFRDLFLGLDVQGKENGWSLVREHPDGSEVCASCHNPAPSGQPNFLGTEERHWGNVHCDFCHKISGPASGDIGLAHGRHGLELLRPREGQLILGPLEDAARRENAFSPFQRDSRLCASCHEGVVFGVSVYSTYSEWLASPAGQSGIQCQACHMKPTGKMTNIAPDHGGVERNPAAIANHRFFDTDQRTMLARSLKLNLTCSAASQGVRASVTVTAEGVGHRVPTGLPDRNLVLVVEAFDAMGKPLKAVDGPSLPSSVGDEFHGISGKLFAKMLRDSEGRSPVPFWQATQEFTDTRLRPGIPERSTFSFPAEAAKISAKLVYRRFWPGVAKSKGWQDDTWIIVEMIEPITKQD